MLFLINFDNSPDTIYNNDEVSFLWKKEKTKRKLNL